MFNRKDMRMQDLQLERQGVNGRFGRLAESLGANSAGASAMVAFTHHDYLIRSFPINTYIMIARHACIVLALMQFPFRLPVDAPLF